MTRVTFALILSLTTLVARSALGAECNTPMLGTGSPYGGSCSLVCDGSENYRASSGGLGTQATLECDGVGEKAVMGHCSTGPPSLGSVDGLLALLACAGESLTDRMPAGTQCVCTATGFLVVAGNCGC